MSGRDASNGAGAVGESPWRSGGRDRVTGRLAYVADIPVEDALHVKLVTVDAARARIGRIDATRALAVPGVRLVMTPDDLPSPMPRFGPQLRDRPVLAVGTTAYHGEPVAAVAAETRDAAEEAAALVEVEHEPLPAVTTIAAALDPASPLVQDPSLRPGDPLAGTNTLREHAFGWGDLAAAEREAEVVVEGTWTFPMVTQFAIEPHAFIAAPDGDGIAVWSSIQHPYWLQRVIATLLDLPLSRVRVFAPDPGGGFGGKQHAKYEPLLAFMARRAGRPVRLVLTLEETFQAVRRAASEVRVRSGFHRDGTLAFRDIEANYLVGAYADIADRVVAKGSYTSNGPYRTPAVRIRARSLLSNTVPSTAFRGFGNPQQIWAVESNLDEAAVRLGIDPLELRLRNLAHRGDPFIPGDLPADGEWAETVRRAADRIGWGSPVPPGRGRGIAVGLKEGPTTGPVLLDGPAAGRRQRRPDRRDVGHGAGGAHDLRPDRGPGAGGAGRLGHGGQRRHRERPVRPADVGQPVVGADGECRAARVPRRPGEARGDGRAAGGGRRRRGDRGPGRGADRRPCVADHRRADPRPRAGWAARSSGSARCARRRRRSIRWVARPRSTSSTAPPSRCRSTGRPAT